jgi:DNA-binding XRE family transcriptional regulator
MSHQSLPHYLRTHRLTAGLTQPELAALLGVTDDVIGAIERGHQGPTLRLALGAAKIFGVPINDLFPDIHAEAEHGFIERASKVFERVNARNDAWSKRKAAFIGKFVSDTTLT